MSVFGVWVCVCIDVGGEFGPSVAGAHVVSAKNSLHYDGREALEDYSFNCVAVDLLSSAHEAIEAEAGPRPARSDEWVGL